MLENDHFVQIYQNNASEYHRMIDSEDVDCQVLKALEEICDLDGKTILDLGSGTGRIPLMLKGKNVRLSAVDLHRHMLLTQLHNRSEVNGSWSLLQADMSHLPIACRAFDCCIAGWSIGHSRSWYPDTWLEVINTMLGEMTRVTQPGGTLIIMETLGTGALEPDAPSKELKQYYHFLEDEHHYNKMVIATDYQFETVDQAVLYTRFFFGDELAEKIRKNGWSRLPEFTGIWYKTT